MFSSITFILTDGGITKRGYTMSNNEIGIVPPSPTYKISYRSTEGEEEVIHHDFIEQVMDRLQEEGVELDFDNEEVQEQISDLVGQQVLPLLLKLMEWGIGKELPKLNEV